MGRHWTTRPALVVAFGFMGLTLYGLWAAYGAAPTSLSFLDENTAGAGAGAGHGHGMGAGGMSPDEFQQLTEEFIEANVLPDGSVRPGMRPMADMAGMAGMDKPMADMAGMAGMDKPMADMAGMAGMSTPDHAHEGGGDEAAGDHAHQDDAPIDVYLMAFRYSYEPEILRLKRFATYNFRMMAIDVTHGASISFGRASQINRLRAGVLVEKQMRFTRRGEYTIYCTVYCGLGHDLMRGARIIVE
jgi:heme/copper-type cytochrome/quinol oxidase subunit 2